MPFLLSRRTIPAGWTITSRVELRQGWREAVGEPAVVPLGAAWGKELALQMLQEAGFAKVEVRELPHDILNYYYIARPD